MHRKWQQENIKTIAKNSEDPKSEKADSYNSFFRKTYDYGPMTLSFLICNAIYIITPEKHL